MSKKYEEIEYPDGRVVFIGKLPRSRLGALEVMLHKIQQRWLEFQRFSTLLIKDEPSWEIFKNVAALFPRFDRPGEWGFDLDSLRNDVLQLESLFLFQSENGTYTACRLMAMHVYEPLPRPEPTEERSPIQPTDDPDMDLLASLSVGFESAQEAFSIYDRLDAQSIDRFLFMVGELRRDPEEREQEELAEDYAGWKEENGTEFKQSLGIKFDLASLPDAQPEPAEPN
ncbi:hypothetical protein H6G00_01570 [Leptolyngbya sp. FACHB-541]|uniref:hypothetical protein n=1 Tax=Leptolyngbya sp. FACHB-541 TaxID=2692810 RepID=UPI00168792E0|nr:hypothetical protein [Leptolyngbya sp. FACHB-541]MBD1995319.1 hypothetical protein [Leptolyngbya sp. FACHB-541]